MQVWSDKHDLSGSHNKGRFNSVSALFQLLRAIQVCIKCFQLLKAAWDILYQQCFSLVEIWTPGGRTGSQELCSMMKFWAWIDWYQWELLTTVWTLPRLSWVITAAANDTPRFLLLLFQMRTLPQASASFWNASLPMLANLVFLLFPCSDSPLLLEVKICLSDPIHCSVYGDRWMRGRAQQNKRVFIVRNCNQVCPNFKYLPLMSVLPQPCTKCAQLIDGLLATDSVNNHHNLKPDCGN